ncbi:Rop guanine nucleotide exchange factor 1 [Camellia lanceoleosa]|uniref:Rop guanine nucleotide exchange factor 1 n=1 Tax=Camellia lanceoleosa TaxID=1840588 RepID=A0ACC0IYM3_9ERIC|nr:Rop guanine nucleotide exchange factor 1 [Camellia lanceoleosa]
MELVPSIQQFAGGGAYEVMLPRPSSDLCINLPALKKLDAMLIGILDGFQETKFCYVDRGIIVGDANDDFEFGKQVHAEVVKVFSLSDEYLGTNLLRMYSGVGEIDSAKKVFDKMPKRDLVTWNALIFSYSKCGMGDVSVELFR